MYGELVVGFGRARLHDEQDVARVREVATGIVDEDGRRGGGGRMVRRGGGGARDGRCRPRGRGGRVRGRGRVAGAGLVNHERWRRVRPASRGPCGWVGEGGSEEEDEGDQAERGDADVDLPPRARVEQDVWGEGHRGAFGGWVDVERGSVPRLRGSWRAG